MLTKEQREAIYRLALQQQYADLSDYLDSITVPEGWQVVPVEPTESMVNAALRYDVFDEIRRAAPIVARSIYDAMLAAAPKPRDSNE